MGRISNSSDVRRIQLEKRNAELQIACDESGKVLEKYADLYDLAPIGYFVFSPCGAIQMANVAGARLLGIGKARLPGRAFGPFVSQESRPAFRTLLKKVFAGHSKQVCELALLNTGRASRRVNMEVQRLIDGLDCLAVVVDITDHKEAEELVRVSEVRYRRLFEAAHDGVLLLDPDTRKITDANPFMTKLLGYPHDRLVGKELFEIGLLKDEAASQKMFRELKSKHNARYENLPLESEEGRHQDVEVVANLYQENGHAVIQCNIRDITERKQAAVVSNRLAAIVESSNDAIIGIDLKGTITSWNKGAEKVFGYKPCGMVGTSIMQLVPDDLHHEEAYIMATVKRGQNVQHFETLRRAKDGRFINISVTASPIKDGTGRIIGVSKVARDITERKHVDEVLRRNEALFSALIAQAPVGVYVVDARLQLQQVNLAAEGAFKSIQPLIGRKFSEVAHILWPRRVAEGIVKRFRHTLKSGEPYRSPEFVERRQDTGTLESYEWQIQRVLLPAGEMGVVCFFNDLTERKTAEETKHRLEVMAATNRELHGEIMRRQAVEEALRISEEHQKKLLEQSKQLTRQLLHAQEEERLRISRELHDEIAQTLVGINIRLAALREEAGAQGPGFRQQLIRTQRLMEKSVDIVHRFARDLRPPILDDLGLIPALNEFVKAFVKQTGLRVRLAGVPEVEQLDISVRTVLYRVVQEALANVNRHAQASAVEIVIQKGHDEIGMTIKDNGKCPKKNARQQAQRGKRLGVVGMRERLEMVGGSFHIQCVEGKGTTVQAQVPFCESKSRV